MTTPTESRGGVSPPRKVLPFPVPSSKNGERVVFPCRELRLVIQRRGTEWVEVWI